MKKFFSFLTAAILTLGFTACEDVPAPYEVNDEGQSEIPGKDDIIVEESFNANLGSFQSIQVVGDIPWAVNFGSAQVTAFIDSDGDGQKENMEAESWLVSKPLDLTAVDSAYITFDYILRYAKSNQIKTNYQVVVSKDFSTQKVEEATWTPLDINLVQSSDWDTWVNLGVDIPAEFCGVKGVTIAIVYKSTDKAATWEIKNLSVKKGTVGSSEGDAEGVKTLPYTEAFATDMGAFKNYTTSGAGEWKIDFQTAKASGFDFDAKLNTAGVYYLVSPEISLAGKTEVHFTYDYIVAYANKFANGEKLFITSNFDESKADQNWTELPVQHKEPNMNAEGKIDWKAFHKMDVQVPAEFLGKNVRIAFRHECDDKGSATWELKNFKIEEGKAEAGETPDVKPEVDAIFSAALSSEAGGFENFLGTSEWNWVIDTNYSCAKASGHVGGKEGHKVPGVAYFVSPEISLENVTEAHLAYTYAIGYMSNQEYHKVMINDHFDPAAPEAGWVALAAEHKFVDRQFAWFDNDIQLPAEMMGKKVRIAFRYECDDAKASTWEIKDVKVVAGKAESGNEGGGNEGGGSAEEGDVNALNGDFECWVGGQPNNWASIAGNATLSLSDDAHSGKHAVRVAGYSGGNKRLSYKPLELKAGTYTMKFFVKAATADGGSIRPGYAIITEPMGSDSYKYGDYTDGLNDQWVEVVHEFTLDTDGLYSPIVMNGKRPGKDVLIDDFTLTDASGNVIIK